MDQNPQPPQVSPKQQVAERLRQATNVLVTVKTDPTVDELAATIGLTLMLNKMGKHATAVFSGQIPSTLEFLQPEDTIETNTDSLRDFIVSLDKSKADKLRYKVEENVVKIFITPYRTSITEADLEFTQGDFNVDVVMALGVTQREQLDQAVVAHGRILHDATVVTVTVGQEESSLGNLNWQEPAASSLCEMLVSISEALQGGIIDSQMATAFLTGIVSETQRFSNPKTSPKVMTMAAQLMAAGANQHLIANELEKAGGEVQIAGEEAEVPAAETPAPEVPPEDGALTISHEGESEQPAESQPQPEEPKPEEPEEAPTPAPSESETQPVLPDSTNLPATAVMADTAEEVAKEIHIDEEGNLLKQRPDVKPKHKVIHPIGNEEPAEETQAEEPKLEEATLPLPDAPADDQPAPVEEPKVDPGDTISDIEKAVRSPHANNAETDPQSVDEVTNDAREAVQDAINQIGFDPNRPEPRVDLNAQPIELPEPVDTGEQQESNNNDTLPPPPPLPPPFTPSMPS